MLALLRNRDGNLSSIHRSMVNKNKELSQSLGLEVMPVISRSHLPILLQKIDVKAFSQVLVSFAGVELRGKQQSWFAVDGKELKGSIEKGDKRGQALVLAMRVGIRLEKAFTQAKKKAKRPVCKSCYPKQV